MADEILYPGGTVGIVGDGENGSMLVNAARQVGFKVGAYGPEETSQTLQLADFKIIGALTDRDRLQDFAQSCDVVTYASKHLNASTISLIQEFTKVPQGSDFQMMMQDRLLERAFYEQLNVNIPPYATIVSLDDVYREIGSIGYPSILRPIQKDAEHGEEVVIRTQTDIAKGNGLMDWGTYILEALIEPDREVALTIARDHHGEFKVFPAVELIRHNGKVSWVSTPVKLAPDTTNELYRLAQEIVGNIKYVGVFEVRFLITKNGSLYVQQVTPTLSLAGRVFDQATTVSQYEQHMRAILGMPLSDPELVQPTVLAFFNESQLPAIKTQWLLKNNWRFSYYRVPPLEQSNTKKLAGQVIVQGADLTQLVAQLEDTGVWSKDRLE